LRQKLFDAALHFAGGFVGKGNGQNLPRLDTLRQQMDNPSRNHSRFAGARTGKD
jgi:hypothetical protein